MDLTVVNHLHLMGLMHYFLRAVQYLRDLEVLRAEEVVESVHFTVIDNLHLMGLILNLRRAVP